jgi:hypothetical protein
MAESVLWPPRLLHTNIGLSHGVSGIAYVYLALSTTGSIGQDKWRGWVDHYVQAMYSCWGES